MRAYIDNLEFEVISSPLWWQEQHLSYTSSGYGKRIPTAYKVQFNNKWRRVYCYIFSNIGTLYIGKNISCGIIVNIQN